MTVQKTRDDVRPAPEPAPKKQPLAVNVVRRRRRQDLGACARLLRVVWFEGHSPSAAFETPRAWLDSDEVIDAWVAEWLGEILGHVALSRVGADSRAAMRWHEITGHEPARLAVVSRLFVRPRVRGQGLGSALLATALDGARVRGLVPVLELDNPGEDATALCEDRGWRLLAVDTRREGRAQVPVHRYAAPAL
jgi:GNAT superfamily N-acetyltransferase